MGGVILGKVLWCVDGVVIGSDIFCSWFVGFMFGSVNGFLVSFVLIIVNWV